MTVTRPWIRPWTRIVPRYIATSPRIVVPLPSVTDA
jgi:hypothetical protein